MEDNVRFRSGNYRVINYHMDTLYMVQGYMSMKDEWFNIVAYNNLALSISAAEDMCFKDSK